MMDESQLANAPRRNRERPPRVLSAEQQLLLRIRSKISGDDNQHRLQDKGFLKQNRQTNRDTHELMLAFDRVSTRYSLFTVHKIHELLLQQGVECPSEFIEDDAIWAALAINGTPRGFSRAWDRGLSFGEESTLLIVFALTAGVDRDNIVTMVKERGIKDVSEIKSILAETKGTHQSLTSGAL